MCTSNSDMVLKGWTQVRSVCVCVSAFHQNNNMLWQLGPKVSFSVKEYVCVGALFVYELQLCVQLAKDIYLSRYTLRLLVSFEVFALAGS